MKYFLNCDTMVLYSVPKKYWIYLYRIEDAIIEANSENEEEQEAKIDAAINFISYHCKPKLTVFLAPKR